MSGTDPVSQEQTQKVDSPRVVPLSRAQQFGRMPEALLPTGDLELLREVLKSLPVEEQEKALNQIVANIQKEQEQNQLQVAQLSIFVTALNDTLSVYESPRGTVHTFVKFGSRVRELCGFGKSPWCVHEDEMKERITDFLDKEVPKIERRLQEGESLEGIIKEYNANEIAAGKPGPGLLQLAADKYKLDTRPPKTEIELRETCRVLSRGAEL